MSGEMRPRFASNRWQIELTNQPRALPWRRYRARVIGKGIGLFQHAPTFRRASREAALAAAERWCWRRDMREREARRTLVEYDATSGDTP